MAQLTRSSSTRTADVRHGVALVWQPRGRRYQTATDGATCSRWRATCSNRWLSQTGHRKSGTMMDGDHFKGRELKRTQVKSSTFSRTSAAVLFKTVSNGRPTPARGGYQRAAATSARRLGRPRRLQTTRSLNVQHYEWNCTQMYVNLPGKR